MTQAFTIGQAISYQPGHLDLEGSRRSVMTQRGHDPLHAVIAYLVSNEPDEYRATLSVLDHSGVWHTREAVAHAAVDDPEHKRNGHFQL